MPTFADLYSLRTSAPKMNDVADALDGVRTERNAGTSTGSSNTYAVTVSPGLTANTLVAGVLFGWVPNHDNTGGSTLNANSTGAKNVRYNGGILVGGELVTGRRAVVQYDGTDYVLLNHGGGWATWTPTLGAVGAMTFTGTTVAKAVYQYLPNLVRFTLSVTGTTGGTANNALTATLPLPADLADAYPAHGVIFDPTYSGSWNHGYALVTTGSANTLHVRHSNNQNFGLGATRGFSISGIYKTS